MPDVVTNVLYAEIDRLQEKVKELEAERDAAQGDNGKLREAIETMILFIPDGWQMPLGWNQVVAQAQEALGGKP